jgi:molybdopterin synthase sulfur carrier subunit
MNETAFIHVHYWASARAAAGVAGDDLPVTGALTLSEIRRLATDLHPGSGLEKILAACSTLVGDLPVGSSDPATVLVGPGSTVEFLPPFAGG